MTTGPELVGLLYRADWTRLALSGTVRCDGAVMYTGAPLDAGWSVTNFSFGGWVRTMTPEPPWVFQPDPAGGVSQVSFAPGRRFRVDDPDGSRAFGSDGERLWHWRRDRPAGSGGQYNGQVRPPYRRLLMPSWLLNGYTLTIEGEETACGRAGLRVRATPKPTNQRTRTRSHRPSGRLLSGIPPRLRDDPYDAVDAVVDAELGILLRCARHCGDEEPLVTAFESLAVAAAEAARFSAPANSGYLGGPAPASPLESLGREAAKTMAGLAAGGIGALLKLRPASRPDPFAQATTEDFDPDDVMPADEPVPSAASALDAPVSDAALYALYQSGSTAPRFTATLHEWFDGDGLFDAIPEPARQAGFGGVGLLVDTVRGDLQADGPAAAHEISTVRMGGWREFRIDMLRRSPLDNTRRLVRAPRSQRQPGTVAADGTQEWRVFADRFSVRPALPVPPELRDLLDQSWLLECDLSDGEPVTVAGRSGFRFTARARDTAAWWDRLLFPAVAVVDAETGLLLRLTRFTGGHPVSRVELRDIEELPADADFGFSPPDDLPQDA